MTSQPTDTDWRWADVVVLIKRAGLMYAAVARAAGVPIVWDALDFWRQPAENDRDETDARLLFKAQIAEIRPTLTIGATQAMADACVGAYLPHHSWAGLTPTPARERVSVVAYEGNQAYLGNWGPALYKQCASRGWLFAVNAPNGLREADIIVALRDDPWDGWMCREWKSGVKVVNAIAAGRPIIGQASAAMRELLPPSTIVESVDQLDAAFDAWEPISARADVVEACAHTAPTLTLSAVAARYTGMLACVVAGQAEPVCVS